MHKFVYHNWINKSFHISFYLIVRFIDPIQQWKLTCTSCRTYVARKIKAWKGSSLKKQAESIRIWDHRWIQTGGRREAVAVWDPRIMGENTTFFSLSFWLDNKCLVMFRETLVRFASDFPTRFWSILLLFWGSIVLLLLWILRDFWRPKRDRNPSRKGRETGYSFSFSFSFLFKGGFRVYIVQLLFIFTDFPFFELFSPFDLWVLFHSLTLYYLFLLAFVFLLVVVVGLWSCEYLIRAFSSLFKGSC